MPRLQTAGQIADVNYIVYNDAIDATYFELTENPINWADALYIEVPTSQDILHLPYFDDAVGMDVGVRGQAPSAAGFLGGYGTVTVREREKARSATRHEIAQDLQKLIMKRLQTLAQEATMVPHDDIIDINNNGETATYTLYDGVPYYDNAHPKGSGLSATTFDNLLSGALSNANLQSIYLAMEAFPSDQPGRPLGLTPNILLVPTALRFTALELNNSTISVQSNVFYENILQGLFTVIVDAMLDDANDYYVIKGDSRIKPYVRVDKTGFGPTLSITGDQPNTPEWLTTVVTWYIQMTTRTWPTRPELAIKVVN